jgi:hypothetical protein
VQSTLQFPTQQKRQLNEQPGSRRKRAAGIDFEQRGNHLNEKLNQPYLGLDAGLVCFV